MNQKRIKYYLLLVCIVILTFCGCKTVSNEETESKAATATNDVVATTESVPEEEIQTVGDSKLRVDFIDVGQADSILITSEESTMLIDAGNNADKEVITSYLQQRGIEKIDYLVGTHPDEDHIGSLDTVINEFDIGKIYMPKIQANTQTFEDVLTAISNKNKKVTTPVANDIIQFNNATITILAPLKEYKDNNNNSIVLKLVYNDVSFLFMGDAELEAENDILNTYANLSATVLKVGHHGSSSSTSGGFLDRVSPKYAVISCGVDNKYGHPHKETMNILAQHNVTVYRTDQSGTITMETDGKNVIVKTENDTIETQNIEETESPQDQESGTYIGNKNSKVFHDSSCNSLPAQKNQVLFSTREEAIEDGYKPCQRCNP